MAVHDIAGYYCRVATEKYSNAHMFLFRQGDVQTRSGSEYNN